MSRFLWFSLAILSTIIIAVLCVNLACAFFGPFVVFGLAEWDCPFPTPVHPLVQHLHQEYDVLVLHHQMAPYHIHPGWMVVMASASSLDVPVHYGASLTCWREWGGQGVGDQLMRHPPAPPHVGGISEETLAASLQAGSGPWSAMVLPIVSTEISIQQT